MARVLLHGPAWLHPILTPIMFTGLIFSGVLLTLGAQWREKIRAWHLVVLAGFTWFALPAFGTVYFWRTGTADYGYSLAFATAFLVPYRFWIDRKDYRFPGGPLFVFAGFLAGCSNENVGMLAILTALGVTLCRRQTRHVPAWAAAGITGAVAGWLLMMAAPGNAVRLNVLGGMEKIPALSLESLHRFLRFWGTQEIEMLPYVLVALAGIYLLYRQGRLKPATLLPGLVFFFMAQASLAAFIFSPSTPYRAMSATFFYMALCCFAFIAAFTPLENKGWGGSVYAVFCAVLLSSVLVEIHVFVQAQPAIAARNHAMAQGTVTAAVLAYPKTDKYFFPGYDIIEINSYGPKMMRMVPWDETVPLGVAGASVIRGTVICNMVYLDKLPPGTVHVAAIARRQTAASAAQAALRLFSPLSDWETTSTAAVTARYAPASATITADGRAALHIPGIADISDVAYAAVKESGKPMIWRRITVQMPPE